MRIFAAVAALAAVKLYLLALQAAFLFAFTNAWQFTAGRPIERPPHIGHPILGSAGQTNSYAGSRIHSVGREEGFAVSSMTADFHSRQFAPRVSLSCLPSI